MPMVMDRSFDVPRREEMEASLRAYVERTALRVRYGCALERVSRSANGLVLQTSDGEFRCKAAVFALGVTQAWWPPIPGAEEARHYVDTGRPADYDAKRVVIIGKRNAGFELAQGLLAWAREITLISPRPVETAVLALSALRVRYLQPYDEYVRGGFGTYVVDGAIERIERANSGFRVHAAGTTWPGKLDFDADEVIVATGFRTPLEPLAELDIATVADGRIPAQTPFWESISAPGVYFAGNATQGARGMAKHGAAANSTSVNGFRYNARVLARHIAEENLGIRHERPRLERDEVMPLVLAELARAPELWIQKGYLGRVLSFGSAGIRDEGIVPPAHFSAKCVVTCRSPQVAKTTQLDRSSRFPSTMYARAAIPMTTQSQSPSWKNQSRPPPMVVPATTWSQKPVTRESPASMLTATPRRRTPYAIVTIAVQSPPPEIRSVTKNQVLAAAAKTSSGKRKVRHATKDATTAASSSTSTQNRKPRNTPL